MQLHPGIEPPDMSAAVTIPKRFIFAQGLLYKQKVIDANLIDQAEPGLREQLRHVIPAGITFRRSLTAQNFAGSLPAGGHPARRKAAPAETRDSICSHTRAAICSRSVNSAKNSSDESPCPHRSAPAIVR